MLYALLILADAATLPDINLVCDGSSMVGGGVLDRGPPTQRSYTVQFRIIGGAGEIYLPSPGGGIVSKGWEPVKDLAVTDELISAKVKTTIFSYSKFTIDRVTGVMNSSGGFSGQCRKVEGKAF